MSEEMFLLIKNLLCLSFAGVRTGLELTFVAGEARADEPRRQQAILVHSGRMHPAVRHPVTLRETRQRPLQAAQGRIAGGQEERQRC